MDNGQNQGPMGKAAVCSTWGCSRVQAHLSLQVSKPGWNLETGPQQSPTCPSLRRWQQQQQHFFFKSNVAWKSLLQQLPLKPIVSSAPLTCQLLAAADGANTPRRAAIQFKITSPAQAASEPAHLQISPNRRESLRAQFDHAAS